MSKTIVVSDDVYERLTRTKGDRTYSEIIESQLESGGDLSAVVGCGALDTEATFAANEEIERMSLTTLTKVDSDER